MLCLCCRCHCNLRPRAVRSNPQHEFIICAFLSHSAIRNSPAPFACWLSIRQKQQKHTINSHHLVLLLMSVLFLSTHCSQLLCYPTLLRGVLMSCVIFPLPCLHWDGITLAAHTYIVLSRVPQEGFVFSRMMFLTFSALLTLGWVSL